MRLKRAMKNYYNARLNDTTAPRVPALNFLQGGMPVKKHTSRKDMLLNVFVHAALAVALIFAFIPDRRDSELSLILGRSVEELSLNKNINNGLVTISRYFKASFKSN